MPPPITSFYHALYAIPKRSLDPSPPYSMTVNNQTWPVMPLPFNNSNANYPILTEGLGQGVIQICAPSVPFPTPVPPLRA